MIDFPEQNKLRKRDIIPILMGFGLVAAMLAVVIVPIVTAEPFEATITVTDVRANPGTQYIYVYTHNHDGDVVLRTSGCFASKFEIGKTYDVAGTYTKYWAKDWFIESVKEV